MVITALRSPSFQTKDLPAIAILWLGLIVVEPFSSLEIEPKNASIVAHRSIEKFATIGDDAIQIYPISEIRLQLIGIDYFMESYPCLSLDWCCILHNCWLLDISRIKRNEEYLV